MVLEELVLKVRMTFGGVAEGVNAAKQSLSELNAEKEKLAKEIRLRMSAPELLEMQKQLRELQRDKDRLESQMRIPANTDGIKALRAELEELRKAKTATEGNINVTTDTEGIEKAEAKIADLKAKMKELEAGIKIKVDAEKEAARAKLAEIEAQMAAVNEGIKIKVDASGLEQMKTRLAEIARQEQEVAAQNKELEKNYVKVGAAGTAAFAAIVKAIGAGVSAYVQFNDTMKGFDSGMRAIGVSAAEAQAALENLNTDKLMGSADVAQGIKNLTAYGLTMEQTVTLMGRLKDSATTNRQAHYTLSEAVRVTTEGIKNENSVNADAVGVTKNLAKMIEEYAKSLGKTTEALTQAERAQAVYNGFMQETEAVAGQAATYADELGGSLAQSAAAGKELGVAFGESVAPAVQAFSGLITKAVRALTDFIKENQALVVAATTAGIALSGFMILTTIIPLIQKAAAAWKVFDLAVSTSGIGLIITGIALALGTVIGVIVDTTTKMKEFQERVERVRELLDGTVNAGNLMDYEEETARLDGLIQKAEELKSLFEEGDDSTPFDAVLGAQEGALEAWDDIITAVEEYGIETDKATTTTETFALIVDGLSGKYAALSRKMQPYINEQTRAAAAQEELEAKAAAYAAPLKELGEAYTETDKAVDNYVSGLASAGKALDKIREGEKLTLNEMQSLMQTYPELTSAVAKYGVGIFDNVDALEAVILASRESRKEQVQNQIDLTDVVIMSTRARIEGYSEEIYQLSLLGKATVDVEALRAQSYESINKLLEEKEKLLAGLNLLNSEAANIPIGGEGSGGKKASKTAEESARERYDIEYRALQDRKALTEMGVEAELEALALLRERYADYAGLVIDLDKQMYSLRRNQRETDLDAYLNDMRERASIRSENVDFSALIAELDIKKQELIESLAAYPITLKTRLDEINDIQTDLLAKRVDKINAAQREVFKATLEELDKEAEYLRALSGAHVPGANGEESKFTFTADDEIAHLEAKLERVNAEMLSLADAFGGELSKMADSELAYYNDLLAQRSGFEQQLRVMSARFIKERQKAEEDAEKERVKALEAYRSELLKKEKQMLSDRKAATKELYDYEIERAREAADAEISILQGKIRQIEDIMQSLNRAEEEEDFQDKLNRLNAQLQYETDDGNRYELQKEIDNLTAERQKTLRRQSLEDEKQALSDQIAAVREGASRRIDELQKERDAAIKTHEEAYKAFEERIEKEHELQKTDVDIKETQRTESQDRMEKAEAEHAAASLQITQQTANKSENIMKTALRNVLSSFEAAIAEFAEIGRRQGAAYAEAFRREAESVSGASADGQGASYGAGTTNNITNNFNTPVVSYSEISKATEQMSEQLARV